MPPSQAGTWSPWAVAGRMWWRQLSVVLSCLASGGSLSSKPSFDFDGLWGGYLTSLCLSFHICKMETVRGLTAGGCRVDRVGCLWNSSWNLWAPHILLSWLLLPLWKTGEGGSAWQKWGSWYSLELHLPVGFRSFLGHSSKYIIQRTQFTRR